jgi:hypothetical protein
MLYGMELIIPKATPLIQLELFQKRMLKQILSLPTSRRCSVCTLQNTTSRGTNTHEDIGAIQQHL